MIVNALCFPWFRYCCRWHRQLVDDDLFFFMFDMLCLKHCRSKIKKKWSSIFVPSGSFLSSPCFHNVSTTTTLRWIAYLLSCNNWWIPNCLHSKLYHFRAPQSATAEFIWPSVDDEQSVTPKEYVSSLSTSPAEEPVGRSPSSYPSPAS